MEAGWENRIGALGGGLPVRAFRLVSICKVVPLVPTGVMYGGTENDDEDD